MLHLKLGYFFLSGRKAGCLQNLIEFHGCLQIRVFCDHKTLSSRRVEGRVVLLTNVQREIHIDEESFHEVAFF